MRQAILALILLPIAAMPGRGLAETTECTPITSLPATIGAGGVYCLVDDLSSSASTGSAITITANNVTLDSNHLKIGGLAAGDGTQASGIVASDRLNITIRNCGIRGFRMGINLNGDDGGYHLVENNRLDQNTNYGIRTEGDGTTLRSNRVYDTGGSSLPGLGFAYGISAGDDADIIDNAVKGVFATEGSDGSAFGIAANGNTGGEVSRNRVAGLVHDGSGFNLGIWANGGRPVIRDNTIATTTPAGTSGSFYGIRCNTDIALARDNIVVGYGQYNSQTGCTFVSNSNSY